jgi:hypothetical protein
MSYNFCSLAEGQDPAFGSPDLKNQIRINIACKRSATERLVLPGLIRMTNNDPLYETNIECVIIDQPTFMIFDSCVSIANLLVFSAGS